ncbi:MAG: ADOP family duplicated permease [Candidatus Longimicrobiales bacterium M2_2A_002]
MRAVARVRRWISAIVSRGRLEREMSAEMAHHLELEIEDRVRRGMDPAEARRTARRDFGGVERWKEEARSARGLGGWDALRQDLRYAWRTLAGSPGFAAVSVLTLALGIGATTAVFSVVDGLLLEPLGYGTPERIVRLLEYDEAGEGRGTISQANYFDWMDASETLEAGALYDEYRPTLRLEGGARKVDAASVGVDYFRVLGLRPQLGRFFLPEEAEGGSSRVVLGDGLWRDVFGGDPSVIGRVLDLNGFPYTVVGVAPPFEDPGLSGPVAPAPRLWRSPPSYFYSNGRGGRSFTAVARLAPGVSLSQAQSELETIHSGLREEYPEANAGHFVHVVPLKNDLVGDTAPVLWVLLGAVGLVLLIACANVANLLLFRAAGRGREMALRSAIGASRSRIVRQLLVESVLLGLAGAAAGIGVAVVATRGVLALAAGYLPRAESVSMDAGVLGFALLVGLAAAVVFGLVPALHTARANAVEALKEGGRGSAGNRRQGRLRSAVVAGQVSLAVVVMLGAGLLGRSLLRLQAVDPGVEAEGVLVLRLDPPFDPYDASTEEGSAAVMALNERLHERLQRVPGVEAVGLTDLLPMSGSFNGNGFLIVGRPEPAPGEVPSAESRAVDPHYFQAMRIPVIEGRGIEAADALTGPLVVVVNQAFARRWFDGDAVGEAIRMFGRDAEPRRIVGVVGDVTQFNLADAATPTVYVPHPQAPDWMRDEPWVVARTAGDPSALAAPLRSAIHEIDPRIPVYDVAPMRDVVDRTLARPRFRTVLLLVFAGLAFVLSAIGVYGTVAYTVARRLPELGVRMALGATTGRIRRLVVAQGLVSVAIGAATGVLAGFAAVRVLAGFLYGVPVFDPVTFIGAPAALTVVAVVAAWLPASRALRVPPARVLREE